MAAAALSACAPGSKPAATPSARALAARGLSDAALTAATAGFDPALHDLAIRHDPGLRHADLWGRPLGWGRFDLGRVPDLGLPAEQGEPAPAQRPAPEVGVAKAGVVA